MVVVKGAQQQITREALSPSNKRESYTNFCTPSIYRKSITGSNSRHTLPADGQLKQNQWVISLNTKMCEFESYLQI
jgi:hypothetical protein